MNGKKLNLGSGNDIKEGYVNLDSAKIPGVDIVWDIEKLPLPFGDGEFEEVLANDILEHVEYIPVLRDLLRILKPGGELKIRVPHFTSKNNFADPTHKKLFSVVTFDFFSKHPVFGKPKDREYYFDFHFDHIKKIHITFERSSPVFFYNRLIDLIANASPRMQYFYETTMLSRLFPAENILVELVK